MRKVISFLVGVVAFLFFPMAGWGLGDVPGFFQNRCRVAYVAMLVLGSVAVVLFVPNQGRGFGKGEKPLARQKWSLPCIQILSLFMLIAPPYFDRHQIGAFPSHDGFRIAGLALTALGFFLMNWSVVALGRQFSVEVTLQKDHELITTGPYRLVRHPRYLGIIVLMVGIPFVFGTWAALAGTLLLLWVLLWRVKDEEIMMREAFPAQWDDYKKRTTRLIPWVY